MKKFILIGACLLLTAFSFAQTVNQKLQKAFQQFESDAQLKHAISSLYVIDAKTGKAVFDKNSQLGLAPASTQKIITSVTAFELLGKGYQYKTEFGYKGRVERGILKGGLYIVGSGDPTLGSWRYKSTRSDFFYNNLMKSIRAAGINNDTLHSIGFVLDLSRYSDEKYNDSWIWQDLANYYGIGSCALNWRENQFEAIIEPGAKNGDPIKQIKLSPYYVQRRLDVNGGKLFTGKVDSGDNAYFYISPNTYGNEYLLDLKGTIPAGVDSFTVSASHPNPILYFTESLLPHRENEEITDSPNYSLFGNLAYYWGGDSSHILGFSRKSVILYNHFSPSLDSIIYWLNKKSINLYAEALIKTFAYEKKGFGSTDSGVAIVKDFWKQKGLDENELNISDGSGLSPQNRVTTHAQVEILKYAKTRDWFPYFYNSLPEYNGMTMKSGTIKDVKGFCGYHKAKDGKEYIFSFLVNNYNGSSSALVSKMYKVLDVLK